MISLLLQEDKKKLFDIIKKLNARQEYAFMAQVLLRELLPRFSPDELVEEFKQAGGGLKGLLEATEMYSAKHYTRVDRNLKRTFYVQYVLSQMTLLDDKKLEKSQEAAAGALDGAVLTSGERKRDKKAKAKKARKLESTQASAGKPKQQNLFTTKA